MGFTEFDGIPVECPNCGRKHDSGKLLFTIRWSNQHGASIRIFCQACGQWTDRERRHSILTDTIRRASWERRG